MGNIYREIINKIEDNKYYKKFLKNPWPYFVGALIIAILNIALLYLTDIPLRVSSGFLFLGAGILESIGIDVSNWSYFKIRGYNFTDANSFFDTFYTYLNIGIILGALLASLYESQFKVKKIKNKKQIIAALSGGILMGYASRRSFGCNIGAYFSGIASFSLHGWIFALFMFVGAYIGTKILMKYLL